MEEKLMNNYARLVKYLRGYIHRDGIENLIAWLDTTDIATAPATTKYYRSYQGGLVDHLLAVFTRMHNLIRMDFADEEGNIPFSKESIAIVALLHDLDKVNKYSVMTRNKKDENGNWYQEEYFGVANADNPAFATPSEYSLMLLNSFIPNLTMEERLAILHVGGGVWDNDNSSTYRAVGAYQYCPIAYYLHEADFYDMVRSNTVAPSNPIIMLNYNAFMEKDNEEVEEESDNGKQA